MNVVSAWFKDHDVSGLPVLLDPRGALSEAWGDKGIPTTHIISRDGKERARLEGAAEWDQPEMLATLRRLVGAMERREQQEKA